MEKMKKEQLQETRFKKVHSDDSNVVPEAERLRCRQMPGTLRKSNSEPELCLYEDRSFDDAFANAVLGLKGGGGRARKDSPRPRTSALGALAQAVGLSPHQQSSSPCVHEAPSETLQSQHMRKTLKSASARLAASAVQSLRRGEGASADCCAAGEEEEEAAIQRLSDAGTVMKAQSPPNAASKRQWIIVGDSSIKESGSTVASNVGDSSIKEGCSTVALRQKSAHICVPRHISKLLLQSLWQGGGRGGHSEVIGRRHGNEGPETAERGFKEAEVQCWR